MKIFVAVPIYDGSLHALVAKCLMEEHAVAKGVGDELLVKFLPGCSHPAMGRNQLAKDFMDSDCERMFFLDADLTWEIGEIIKLARCPWDFVGGCYRYKKHAEGYPIGWLPKDEQRPAPHKDLIEVATIPGGFMSLSRKVFETLEAKHPERKYEHWGNHAFCHFEMPFKDGRLWGEDSSFCKRWREAGGRIYLKPDITLAHWDFCPTPYLGNMTKWLIANMGEKEREEFFNARQDLKEKYGPKDEPLKFHEPVLECTMTSEELKESNGGI